MQANFSAAYYFYILITISYFIINHIKIISQTNPIIRSHIKKPLPAIADRGFGLFNLFSLAGSHLLLHYASEIVASCSAWQILRCLYSTAENLAVQRHKLA